MAAEEDKASFYLGIAVQVNLPAPTLMVGTFLWINGHSR